MDPVDGAVTLMSCGWDQEWWIQPLRHTWLNALGFCFCEACLFSIRLFSGTEILNQELIWSLVYYGEYLPGKNREGVAFVPLDKLNIFTLINDWIVSFTEYVWRICIWRWDTHTTPCLWRLWSWFCHPFIWVLGLKLSSTFTCKLSLQPGCLLSVYIFSLWVLMII